MIKFIAIYAIEMSVVTKFVFWYEHLTGNVFKLEFVFLAERLDYDVNVEMNCQEVYNQKK